MKKLSGVYAAALQRKNAIVKAHAKQRATMLRKSK